MLRSIGAGLVMGCSLAPVLAAQSAPTQQVVAGSPSHTEADAAFMTGMIGHHAQAVEMVELLKTRASHPEMQALGKRIELSQEDEIKMMQEWLTARGQMAPEQHAHHGEHMMMPGMLMPEQMQQLAAAKGNEFDKLFLQGMISHHQGALTMVEELMKKPGAAQESAIFGFVSDVVAERRHFGHRTHVARG